MTSYQLGHYGFVYHERMSKLPFFIYDMGIECQTDKTYHFNNLERGANFHGYIFQYTLSGEGYYEISSKTYLLKKGMAFISHVPEDSRYFLGNSNKWEFLFLHFDGFAAESFYETVCDITGHIITIPEDLAPIQYCLQFFEKYCKNYSLELYEVSEFLFNFWTKVLRELESPSKENWNLVVFHAYNYIQKNFKTIESTLEIAEECKVSQEYLTRCFHRETGQTPLQLLTKLRLEHAMMLLGSNDARIEDIAKECGFANSNYFAKVFKKYISCSPNEYRRLNSS